MAANLWSTIAAEVLVFALLLFGAAGTPRWPAGWVFLFLFFGGALHITRTIARHDPALLAERMKPPIQRDQPLWDKVLLSALIVLFAAWLVLMGLDAVRFGWSAVPAWVQGIGAAGIAVALWICFLAF